MLIRKTNKKNNKKKNQTKKKTLVKRKNKSTKVQKKKIIKRKNKKLNFKRKKKNKRLKGGNTYNFTTYKGFCDNQDISYKNVNNSQCLNTQSVCTGGKKKKRKLKKKTKGGNTYHFKPYDGFCDNKDPVYGTLNNSQCINDASTCS